MWRWTGRSIFFTMILCLLSFLPVQAQQNLLQNPGFENEYSGKKGRGDFTFAAGWDGWFSESPHTEYWMNVPPTAFPHAGPFTFAGKDSQSIGKGSGTFTAAALQVVPNIPPNAVLRGSAFIYIENAEGTNAQVRIGIGSNIGIDPSVGGITWSDWEKRVNGHHQIAVEHIATGGDVTLFIYANQTWPNDPNAVYIDDAELIITGEAIIEEEVDTSDPFESVASRPSGAPFVVPQGTSNNGEIIHRVGSGDTLASIATGYGVRVDDIVALNGLDPKDFLQLDQELIIATPDPNRANSEDQDTEADSEDQDTDDESQDQDAEVVVAPVATEEVTVVTETETDTVPEVIVESPPEADTQDESAPLEILITQHSSSVSVEQGDILRLTFNDSQTRVVQVTPDFSGGDLPLDFWVRLWNMEPNLVIQDAMLVVDNFTATLSLAALEYNAPENAIIYTATIESAFNFDGEPVDITTMPQNSFANPDIYFQPSDEFLTVMTTMSSLTSTRAGGWFWCAWLNC